MPALPIPDDKKVRLLNAIRGGATRTGACAVAGVGRSTLKEWCASDPAWAEAVEEAESIAETNAAAKVMLAASKDWRAAAWWLEHAPSVKQQWRSIYKNETEISGPGGRPIELKSVVFEPPKEWLEAFGAAMAELPAEITSPMMAGLLEAGIVPKVVGEPEVEILPAKAAALRARDTAPALEVPQDDEEVAPEIEGIAKPTFFPDDPVRGRRLRAADLH
jgi:hypothetical protein